MNKLKCLSLFPSDQKLSWVTRYDIESLEKDKNKRMIEKSCANSALLGNAFQMRICNLLNSASVISAPVNESKCALILANFFAIDLS